MRPSQLPPESLQFRRLLIDALWGERGMYLTEDAFLGECLICGAPIGVTFHGRAPRATLRCHGGCTETELAERLGLAARS
jgi:hypothetical protein